MQASDAATAPTDEHAAEVALPADVVLLVLLPLKGDVRSLCATACVARAWCTAAASPRLWSRIGPFRGAAAAHLTDARLANLVARAGGDLRVLILNGIARSSLTDEGFLAAALRLARSVSPNSPQAASR